MANTELMVELGLDQSVLNQSKGKIPNENFPKILEAIKNPENSPATKHKIASGLSLWCKTAPGNGASILPIIGDVFDTIAYLLLQPDDDVEDSEYIGIQCCAYALVDGVSTACMFDQAKFAIQACPLAYNVLEKLTDATFTLDVQGAYVKKCAATERKEALCYLFRCGPYSGSVRVPNAIKVISHFLRGDFPLPVKQAAKAAMQSMTTINKECVQDSGEELMDIIATREHDELIFNFLSMPELYTRSPAAVHKHLRMLLTDFNWMQICSLVNNVASRYPAELVPYTSILCNKLQEAPMMGAITIGCLKEIGKVDPDTLYPHLDDIIEASKNIQGSSYSVAGCITAVAKSKCIPNAGDAMLDRMISVIKNCEAAYQPSVISELVNLKEHFSSPAVIVPHMEYLLTFKNSGAAIQIGTLEDYAAGRSLQSLEIRVDAVELKITQLNSKVAESCANFEDVMAYVDANMADMKDFIGDVVKKLPSPKRLEVVGTFRKTLILHFECVHTGYEFPIESKEWSKWVKMGFSLAKAGKAVFDIGTGNPLGLLSTGIECVQGIYDAYKTNDDDEFNTYITNPFLTSTEQDQLIEKLRDQGFFDVMAYDNQAPGWYLLNPEKDGTPPAGEHGSVTKVSSKGGGIKEAVLSNLDLIQGALPAEVEMAVTVGTTVYNTINDARAATDEEESPASGESKSPVGSTSSRATSAPGATKGVGARAAQMRTQMAQAGTVDISVVDSKLAGVNQMVAIESKLNALEGQVSSMQKQIQALEATVARHESAAGGCNCTVS